jgi:hypothetical protein
METEMGTVTAMETVMAMETGTIGLRILPRRSDEHYARRRRESI